MDRQAVLLTASLNSFLITEIERHYDLHKRPSPDEKPLAPETISSIKALITSPMSHNIDADFMSQFPNLKYVVNFGVGYDSVDAKWAAEHNIIVTHTPDVLNEEVADLAMGLTLSVVRQLPQANAFTHNNAWENGLFPLSASLRERTMGIYGLGRIGKAIAHRAEAFGLKIIYHGRHKQEDIAYTYYANLNDMAKNCDILLAIAPASAETKHSINAEVLKSLGPNGILINVARGSVVDEEALIEALQNRTILSAGLDVYAHEPRVPEALRALEHVVLLPHIGAASHHTVRAMSQLVLDNLNALMKGLAPLTPVPETPYKG